MNGIKITNLPDILKAFTATQTPSQLCRNVIEIDGMEFVETVVRFSPETVLAIIDNKERASKFQAGGIVPYPIMNKDGSEPEAIIPLDRLHEIMSKGDRRRKHYHAMILIMSNCMLTPGTSVGYYCSTPIREMKDKFIKLFADMQINDGAWMDVDDEIQFNNGSKIVFVCSASIGDFHIVSSEPVEWSPKEIEPWIEEPAPADSIIPQYLRRGLWNNIKPD